MPAGPTLVYLYGPPAVGKLTVALEVQAQTGFRLFDNHLTVDAVRPVFEFASPPFTDVLHRLRLDVFETAARNGIDVIFTNNSVWRIPDGRARFRSFAEQARSCVEAAGGRVVFAQLTAPPEVLEQRVVSDSRRDRGKLVWVERLRELLAKFDPTPLHADDVVIDTAKLQPADAAAVVVQHLAETG